MEWNWLVFFMIVCFPAFAAHVWAENQCTRMDVETGRRDPGALRDDYGSNRGWYWRYKIISIPGALLAAPGMLIWFFMIVLWLLDPGTRHGSSLP